MNDKKVIEIKKQKSVKKIRQLTPKQELFCQLSCNSEHTLIDAYRQSYDADKMTNQSVSAECNKMLNNPLIALRRSEIKSKMEQSHYLRGGKLKDHIIKRLVQLSEGDSSVAVRSLELLGKTEAMFSDKQIIVDDQASDQIEQELLERLNRIA
jgi:hypothetical protein|tara:strand:+ start:294 stop:752 length:459 start_codon:yes stop_codon:yes gene_type:complete